jgi:hypothetical protein
LAPIAVPTPERTPPAMLLRRTTAVDAPGVATRGTVIAANAQTLTARRDHSERLLPLGPLPRWHRS